MGAKKGTGGGKKGRKRRMTPEAFVSKIVPAGPRIDHDQKAEHVEAEFLDADFTRPPQYIDPKAFLEAVINGDMNVLGGLGLEKIPTITQRLDAARIAIPFTNKRLPVEINTRHEHSWAEALQEAEGRLDQRKTMEDIENERTKTTH